MKHSGASGQKMKRSWYGAEERNLKISSDQMLPNFTEFVIAPVAGIKGGAERI